MTQKPIVALAVDDCGNVSLRISGDVTVVWVSDHLPHDRVYESLGREDHASLAAYLGPESEWGGIDDEREQRLNVQMARYVNHGPVLRVVPKNAPDDTGSSQ